MCGRYTLVHTHKELIKRFRVTKALIESKARFNIAPTQEVPIIVYGALPGNLDLDLELDSKPGADSSSNSNASSNSDPEAKSDSNPDTDAKPDSDLNSEPIPAQPDVQMQSRETSNSSIHYLQAAKWGLIPSWSKATAKFKPLINARTETISEKPSFRAAFKKRRCLIPADGFYEWPLESDKKAPVRITLKGAPLFAFAGLYEDWTSPEDIVIRTCTIITVPANQKIATIHDRMPAILLNEASEQTWLTAQDDEKEKLFSCLRQYPDDLIDIYKVSPIVNSVKAESPQCIEPAPEQLKLLPD